MNQNLDDMTTPKKIREVLSKLGEDLNQKQRARFERDLKLSYYYGNQEVACRETAGVLEVIAAGPGDEVAAALNRLKPEELRGVVVRRPEPFDDWVKEMLPSRFSHRR